MNLMVTPERRTVSRPFAEKRRIGTAVLELFPVGTVLCASDPSGCPIYLIYEGCIVYSRLATNGIAQLVDVYGPGDVFVHPSAPSLAEVRMECRYEVLSLRRHARMIYEFSWRTLTVLTGMSRSCAEKRLFRGSRRS